MERDALQYLKRWKAKKNRKPLIISGARQVGKTWLMKEFGKNEFSQVAYVNFESSKSLKNLFVKDFNIERILMALQIETVIQVDANDTLIIFDEIQEAEGAITSLKYFYENAPEYPVIAAGSLLGMALHQNTSFPVGKVEFLHLYPLTYKEFLLATGQKPLSQLLAQSDWSLIKTFKEKFTHYLRLYYYIGGMPEVVSSFIHHNNFKEVREIQKQILSAYEQDFSKHALAGIVPRIRMLWNAVPAQLAKENRKFIYKMIKSGARANDYELALAWLTDCRLVHKITRITKPGIPLKAYEDFHAFKLSWWMWGCSQP